MESNMDINPYELSQRLRDLADRFDHSCNRDISTLLGAADMIDFLAEVNATLRQEGY
jgi:hypothetical protein